MNDLQIILQIIKDRSKDTGFSVQEEAQEVIENIPQFYILYGCGKYIVKTKIVLT